MLDERSLYNVAAMQLVGSAVNQSALERMGRAITSHFRARTCGARCWAWLYALRALPDEYLLYVYDAGLD